MWIIAAMIPLAPVVRLWSDHPMVSVLPMSALIRSASARCWPMGGAFRLARAIDRLVWRLALACR